MNLGVWNRFSTTVNFSSSVFFFFFCHLPLSDSYKLASLKRHTSSHAHERRCVINAPTWRALVVVSIHSWLPWLVLLPPMTYWLAVHPTRPLSETLQWFPAVDCLCFPLGSGLNKGAQQKAADGSFLSSSLCALIRLDSAASSFFLSGRALPTVRQ